MAYTFPLSTARFMGALPIQDITFDLPEAIETSETGGGEILRAELGTRLWQGEITLGEMLPDERDEVMAYLDVLRRAGGSFMVHDARRPGPRLDPTGAGLGAATPALMSVASNSRDVRLSGLPSGYGLRRHDYLAFAYGTNPVRYALHRIAGNATAATNGQTDIFEVSPAVRPGWAAGAPVTLIRAACKAVVVARLGRSRPAQGRDDDRRPLPFPTDAEVTMDPQLSSILTRLHGLEARVEALEKPAITLEVHDFRPDRSVSDGIAEAVASAFEAYDRYAEGQLGQLLSP